jgi:hypothetical protein
MPCTETSAFYWGRTVEQLFDHYAANLKVTGSTEKAVVHFQFT